MVATLGIDRAPGPWVNPQVVTRLREIETDLLGRRTCAEAEGGEVRSRGSTSRPPSCGNSVLGQSRFRDERAGLGDGESLKALIERARPSRTYWATFRVAEYDAAEWLP